MIQFRTKVRTDLDKNLSRYTINGKLFTQDNKANRIDVYVYNQNQKVNVTGTVIGIVKRNDGNAIAFTGNVENGVPYIELPEAAYAVEGPISILVRNVDGENKTVICICDAYVTKSADADYITAGTEVVSIEELTDKLDAIEPLFARLKAISYDDAIVISAMLDTISEREARLAEELAAVESLVTIDEENEMLFLGKDGV